MEAILDFVNSSGFVLFTQGDNWKCLIMLVIACGLLYLGIVKKFEPLLLVPIAFGMLITNLPGAEMYHEIFFAGGHIHWDLIGGAEVTQEFINGLHEVGVSDAVLATVTVGQSVSTGLIDILYLGVKLGVYPCLIFMGVGAMTDFGPLIANPKSLLLGAAAQLGIFMTFVGCNLSKIFTPAQAGSIGIIGGADGPTAIYGATKLAPELLGPIAVAAYSYMALVPVIQPPIMRLLTTAEERKIVMKPLRQVSHTEKVIFPIMVAVFVALLVPDHRHHGNGNCGLRFRHGWRCDSGEDHESLPEREDQSSDRLRRRVRSTHGGPCLPGGGTEGQSRELPADARHGSQRGGRYWLCDCGRRDDFAVRLIALVRIQGREHGERASLSS